VVLTGIAGVGLQAHGTEMGGWVVGDGFGCGCGLAVNPINSQPPAEGARQVHVDQKSHAAASLPGRKMSSSADSDA
jgi:hypothetical protein